MRALLLTSLTSSLNRKCKKQKNTSISMTESLKDGDLFLFLSGRNLFFILK
jgi:hypothetical protein